MLEGVTQAQAMTVPAQHGQPQAPAPGSTPQLQQQASTPQGSHAHAPPVGAADHTTSNRALQHHGMGHQHSGAHSQVTHVMGDRGPRLASGSGAAQAEGQQRLPGMQQDGPQVKRSRWTTEQLAKGAADWYRRYQEHNPLHGNNSKWLLRRHPAFSVTQPFARLRANWPSFERHCPSSSESWV